MNLLTKSGDGRSIYFECLVPPYEWSNAPFNGQPFVALVVNNSPSIANEDQYAISKQLVEFGCRYAVCAGHDCSSWDDSIDWANIELDPELSNEKFVMTTWHNNQSVSNIVNFFLTGTNFDENTFENFLILFIGENSVLLDEYKQACKVSF